MPTPIVKSVGNAEEPGVLYFLAVDLVPVLVAFDLAGAFVAGAAVVVGPEPFDLPLSWSAKIAMVISLC